MPQGEAISLSAGGVTVSALRGGSGPPLVYLHGAGGGGMWWPFLDELAKTHTVYAPEHPGFGASPDSPKIDNVGDVAYFYLELLRDLGPVHLLGESLGGWISAEMAVRDSRDIRTLTLAAPAGLYLPHAPITDIFIMDPAEVAAALFVSEAARAQFLAGVMDMDRLETNLRNQAAAARFGWNPRFHNPDLHKWLCRVRVPTLIAWGQGDGIIPPQYAAEWQRLVPHARVVPIEHAGHLPHVEQPEAFLGAMQAFLQEVGA